MIDQATTGPFALSVSASRMRSRRNRMRSREVELGNDAGFTDADDEDEDATPQPSSNSINPRSHSPDTLRQFAVAGLSPEEEVPSKVHKGFPHRPITQKGPKGKGGRRRRSSGGALTTDDDESDAGPRGTASGPGGQEYSARLKHLNTLTVILHRCLHDGDISRAKRAFSLLTRSREIDLRLNDLWTIGTEILMREGETRRQDPMDASTVGEGTRPPLRWGSAINMTRVRDYLEALIQQHPHDNFRPQWTSAMDFWPTLFNIEIYNIDAECKRALHQLHQEHDEPGGTEEDGSDLSMTYSRDSDDPFTSDGDADPAARGGGGHHRTASSRFASAADHIRLEAQASARHIAARIDQVLDNTAYASHHELLRLRGMLSLYIGDLSLPWRLLRRLDSSLSSSSGRAGDQGRKKSMEIRLGRMSLGAGAAGGAGDTTMMTTVEDQRALGSRKAEFEVARAYFTRVVERGGTLEPWLLTLLEEDDEDDEDEDENEG